MRAFQAAKRFLKANMTTADLVAIMVFTSGSVRVLADFTALDGQTVTVAGRLIWEAPASDGLTTWDGRDSEGDQVANGVYLAQIEAVGEVLADGGQFVDKKAYREMKVVVSR